MGMYEGGYGCHKDISVLAAKETAIIQKKDPHVGALAPTCLLGVVNTLI